MTKGHLPQVLFTAHAMEPRIRLNRDATGNQPSGSRGIPIVSAFPWPQLTSTCPEIFDRKHPIRPQSSLTQHQEVSMGATALAPAREQQRSSFGDPAVPSGSRGLCLHTTLGQIPSSNKNDQRVFSIHSCYGIARVHAQKQKTSPSSILGRADWGNTGLQLCPNHKPDSPHINRTCAVPSNSILLRLLWRSLLSHEGRLGQGRRLLAGATTAEKRSGSSEPDQENEPMAGLLGSR